MQMRAQRRRGRNACAAQTRRPREHSRPDSLLLSHGQLDGLEHIGAPAPARPA